MKKLFSIILVICLILSTFSSALSVFAVDESTLTLSNATVTLRTDLAADFKGSTVLANDGKIGIPAVISTFWRDGVTKCEIPIVYVVGTSIERIGTDSDTDIINDFLDEGFLVIVLDYLNNPRAEGLNLTISAQEFFSLKVVFEGNYKFGYGTTRTREGYLVPSGCRIKENVEFFDLINHSPNGTKEYLTLVWNRYYASSSTYRPENYFRDANGNRLPYANSYEDLFNKDGGKMQEKLYMRIVYHANPKDDRDIPVYAKASSNNYTYSITADYSYSFFHALSNGYDAVLYDHEYIPMSRDNAYGHFDTCFSLSATVANSVHSAAIRCIRYYAEDYGYNADYIMGSGFSKAGFGPGILSDPNHEAKGELETYAQTPTWKFPKEEFPDFWNFIDEKAANDPDWFKQSPEEQPFKTDRYGNPLTSEITCVYSGAGWGCCYNMDFAFTPDSVPFAATIGTEDTSGSFYLYIPSAIANFEKAVENESLFFAPEGMGHEYPHFYDEERQQNDFEPVWTFLDNHIQNAIKPTAPEVIWTSPSNAKLYESTDLDFEIKFSRRMDTESVKKGVKLIRIADGKEVALNFTVLHGQTTFRFTSDGLINASKYRLEITTDCKSADGIAIDKPQTETFTFTGDEFLTVSADTYVSESNPTVNYGTANVLTLSGVGDKAYLAFQGDFSDVTKATLVLSQTDKKNAYVSVYGLNTSFDENTLTYNNAPALSGEAISNVALSDTNTTVDVTDYIKNLNGSTATFGLTPYGKSGVTRHYDFEGYTANDFKSGTHYKWGGGGCTYNLANDGHDGSANSAYITDVETNGERIKLLNSFGEELSTLTSEHLGLKFRAKMYVKPDTDTTMSVSMYGTNGYEGWDAKDYELKANQWNEIIYNVTVTQRMIDSNVTAVTLTPKPCTSFYLDDVTIEYDVNPSTVTSREGAAANSALQAATLVLYKSSVLEVDSSVTSMISSGTNKNTVMSGSSVSGKPVVDWTKVKKGYMKLPISSFASGEAILNFNAAVSGSPEIAVYGILDDTTRFAETFDGNINWNNAYANDITGDTVESGKVYGGEPIATVKAVTGLNQVDVTDYVSYMKNKGYSYVTFIFVAATGETTNKVDFEGISEYTAYSVSSSLKGYPINVITDPKNSDNHVLAVTKSGINGGNNNGFNQALSLTGLIKPNGVWEESDIGSTYTVKFKQYHTSPATEPQTTTGLLSNILPAGSSTNDTTIPGVTRKITLNGTPAAGIYSIKNGEWYDVEFTINVTEETVTKYSKHTAIAISSGWRNDLMAVDDIVVTKKASEVAVTVGQSNSDVLLNFEGISEFNDYEVSSQLNGFPITVEKDPTNPDNQVLAISKSGLNSGTTNGFAQALSFTGLLKENNIWEESDIGTKYTVSFKQYHTSIPENGTTCAVLSNILPAGSSTVDSLKLPGVTRKVSNGTSSSTGFYGFTSDTWYDVEFTFTVTEEFVTNYSNYTAIVISSGWRHNMCYVDNVYVTKELPEDGEAQNKAPYLSFGNIKAYAAAAAQIDGAKPGETVAANVLELVKAPVSDADGLSKMYYTFNKEGIDHPLSAALKLNIESPVSGKTLNVYALNTAVTEKVTWNSALGNILGGNGIDAAAAVFAGSVVLTDKTEYSVDVSEALKEHRNDKNVTLIVCAKDNEDETVIGSAKLELIYSPNDSTKSAVSVSKLKDHDGGLMLNANVTYPVEIEVSSVEFIVDGKTVNYGVTKKGDSYYIDAQSLTTGNHTVSAKAYFADGTTAESTPQFFGVEGVVLGDVNGDGKIDTVDLSDLKLHLAGVLSAESRFIIDAADFNGDTIIDTVDLSALKLKLAGV